MAKFHSASGICGTCRKSFESKPSDAGAKVDKETDATVGVEDEITLSNSLKNLTLVGIY